MGAFAWWKLLEVLTEELGAWGLVIYIVISLAILFGGLALAVSWM